MAVSTGAGPAAVISSLSRIGRYLYTWGPYGLPGHPIGRHACLSEGRSASRCQAARTHTDALKWPGGLQVDQDMFLLGGFTATGSGTRWRRAGRIGGEVRVDLGVPVTMDPPAPHLGRFLFRLHWIGMGEPAQESPDGLM